MIKNGIFILAVLLNAVGYCQNYEVKFSEVEKFGMREAHDRVIGKNENSYDILRSKYSPFGEATIYVDHFSLTDLMKKFTLEVHKKGTYANNYITHKTEFETAFVLDSSLIVLFSTYNTEKTRNELYAVQFVNGYQVIEPYEVLYLKSKSKFDKTGFITRYNPKSKTFCVAGEETDPNTGKENFKVACYDQNLNNLWKQNLDLPYKGGRYELEQMELDHLNRIFLLFRIILDKSDKIKQGLPNSDYYFSLLQLSSNLEDDYLETVLKIEDKIIYNMFLNVKEDEEKIFLTGLYQDKKADLKPHGVYFTEFTKDSIVPSVIKIQSFSEEFIPDFEVESPFTDISREEPVLQLIDFIPDSANGYYLLCEYILINETCSPDYRSGLMNCNYNFYYNDIFVFRFDSTGSLKKHVRVPKKQFTRNDGALYSSFAYGILKNKLVLLYNDHPKNLKPKNLSQVSFMTDPKKSNLAVVSIDEKGLVEKEFVVNNDKKKTWTKPQLFFNNGGKAIIMLGEKGRMFQTLEIR